nr:hypothetical protein MACL_00003399 [Theileria orientalis]
MGFECGPSSDSNDNSVERNDAVPESSNQLTKNSETFECFIASSKSAAKIDCKDNKFSKLEKKWIKCILNKRFENKNTKEAVNRQIVYCNKAIETTLIKLNNYESVLLFSYILYKNRNDEEFVKSVCVLCIRWYFCLKYNFLLPEAPYLAVAVFNSLIWGLKSVDGVYVQFIRLLLGVHERTSEYISPMLSYTDEWDGEGEECANVWLIEVCPVFAKFQSAFEPKEFCNQVVSYVFDVTVALSKKNMVLKYDGRSDGMTEVWNELMTWKSKSGCSCQEKGYIMLLDAYADMVFNGALPDETRNERVMKLVGLYAKWLLALTNERYVETSVLKRSYEQFNEKEDCQKDSDDEHYGDEGGAALENIQKTINGMECAYLDQSKDELYKCNNMEECRGFIEGCRSYVPFSYSRVIREAVAVYKKYEAMPREMVIVAMGYVNYERGKEYEKCTDFATLDGVSYVETLTLSLYRHEIGRMILSVCKANVNYVKCEEDGIVELDENSDDYTHDVISEYCYRIYSSIADSCGVELDSKRLKVCVSTSLSTKVESGYVHYDFPEESAEELLKELVREVKNKITSAAEVCIYSEALEQNHEMTREEVGFIKSSSALPCVLIALASLMSDDVYLDTSSEGVVRVVVSCRSVYEYSEEKLSLCLKLFYCEVEDDCMLSLEYRNAELAHYRTQLLRYLLQLSLSPMNRRSKLRFAFNGTVDTRKFTMRLFKFLNFRTNSALMDRIVFEKYLTTRVVIEHKSRTASVKSKKNIANGTSGVGRTSNSNHYEYGSRGSKDYEYGNTSTASRRGRKGTRGRRKKGERQGLINGKLKKGKGNESDQEEYEEHDGMPLSKMFSVFGFLEYHGRNVKAGNVKLAVKSEDAAQNEKYFEAEYFFNVSFKFIGVLRTYVVEGPSFGADVVDQLTFKYYLRLCSNDFYNTVNTAIIYSAIREVVDTNEYGDKVENALLAQYLGEGEEGAVRGEYNGFMESLGLLDNEGSRSRERTESKKSWKLQFVDLLKLNNRYTKRAFYTLTHEFCAQFLRFVPNSCLPNLLCSWASSLPTDTMSTVRSEKIATARFVMFTLLCRIGAAKYELSTRFFRALEPLVSAVNVVLVNLEIVYKAPASHGACEVISDDEATPLKKDPCLQSSQEFNELLSGELDVSDSNFYENIVTKYNTIRAENVKRMRERREEMRRRNREQVGHLLHVAWLFGKMMDRITRSLSDTMFDPGNQYVTNTGKSLFLWYLNGGVYDTYVVTCIGKKRALLYSMIDLLKLVDNTLSTIIRICLLSSLSISDSSASEQCTPQRTMDSYKFPKQIKSEASNESEYGHLESMSHSEIIGKIKLHKQSVKSRLKTMSSVEFRPRVRLRDEEESSSEYEDEDGEFTSGDEEEDEAEELASGSASDDLDGFIDFETDQHLSMLTYNNGKHIHNNAKNLGANKRLKMTDLRSEWRCIIKSQLM